MHAVDTTRYFIVHNDVFMDEEIWDAALMHTGIALGDIYIMCGAIAKIVYHFFSISTMTRRFNAIPPSVVFGATGSKIPNQVV